MPTKDLRSVKSLKRLILERGVSLRLVNHDNMKIPVVCDCRKKKIICDDNCDFGNGVVLDLKPETHRNAHDCTCYECMRKETKEFFKTNSEFKSTTYVLD